MKKLFIGLFMLTSVSLSAQWATYTPLTSPTIKLPQQQSRTADDVINEWRGKSSSNSQSTQKQVKEVRSTQITGYQYDSYSEKWYRIGLKLSIEEGVGNSDILSIIGIKEGQYWQETQPLRANSISNRESEFSYYVNLVGGTVYFNY